VDGHLRVEEAISAEAPSVPVIYVELSGEEERKVLATLDPLGAMVGKSDETLAALLSETTVEAPALADMLAKLAKDPRDAYTRKVISPRYEPEMSEAPKTAELYDEGKTKELQGAIRAADLDKDTEAFLLAAATRHTQFHYANIAEFYAHASPEVQRLMEASALVIIDFADAIQQGYVKFTETMASLATLDDEEEEAEGAA